MKRIAVRIMCAAALLASATSLMAQVEYVEDRSGNKYYGDTSNGKLNGVGKIIFANGYIDEGVFADNILNGEGKRTRGNYWEEGTYASGKLLHGTKHQEDGTIISGTLEGNVLTGEGRVTLPNGDVMEGVFAGNRLNGKGRVTKANYSEAGEYKDGRLNGEGSRTMKNGTVYNGTFTQGAFERGKVSYADGSEYEGPIVNGKREGEGRYTYSVDGSVYVGSFANDKPDGNGMLTFKDGTVVDGTFASGEVIGKAIIRYPNGCTYEGPVISRRLRHGTGVMKDAKGNAVTSNFENDKATD